MGLSGKKAEAFATEKHGKTRKNTEKTEAETWKEGTAFRAGCVSDGINILFGKRPFGKLRDRGSFATVSELVELADISCARAKDTAWVINAKNRTPHTRR